MGGDDQSLAKPNGLLEPLPSFNLVESVEKLDAGLRSLDHCEETLAAALRMSTAKLMSRQDETAIMALHASPTTHPPSPLGNTASSSYTKSRSISRS